MYGPQLKIQIPKRFLSDTPRYYLPESKKTTKPVLSKPIRENIWLKQAILGLKCLSVWEAHFDGERCLFARFGNKDIAYRVKKVGQWNPHVKRWHGDSL